MFTEKIGNNVGIRNLFFRKNRMQTVSLSTDEKRPIKFVKESENAWRIVYAD